MLLTGSDGTRIELDEAEASRLYEELGAKGLNLRRAVPASKIQWARRMRRFEALRELPLADDELRAVQAVLDEARAAG